MNDKKIQFLPFHAINEFMLTEFRQEVLHCALAGVEQLSSGRRGALNGMVKRYVKVPGFRNGALAPLPLKVRGLVDAFGRDPQFTAQVLAAWCELHPLLAQQVYDLLKERGWEVLPVDADRTKLPGFLTTWPKADEFEALHAAFRQAHPDATDSDNNISLMAVWLGGRLPVDLVESPAAEA